MQRKLIFLTDRGEEWALPVTPASYSVRTEMGMEVVDVYEVGDYVMPTQPKRQTIKIEALLPAHDYPFADNRRSQQEWVDWLDRQVRTKARLRFIVSGTSVNVSVYMASVSPGERDGTNDLYATITLREYVSLAAPELAVAASSSQNLVRESAPQQRAETQYEVQDGDNLWTIARRFYGDGTLCYALAAYNDLPNAVILHTGDVLAIPAQEALGTMSPPQSHAPQVTTYALTVTLKREISDAGTGSYHWIDPATAREGKGALPAALTLPAGTVADLYYAPGGNWQVQSISVDGTRRTPGNHLRITMSAEHAVDIVFGR